jgi:pSer/pThr/pTyr-binding forkhead associated (FHA) protein
MSRNETSERSGQVEPIQVFLPASRGSVEEFVAEFPHPVLVVDPFVEADETTFLTNVGGKGTGTTYSVGTVLKRQGSNVFESMITIGRAKNNDIIIPATVVSKFHAYVMLGPTGPNVVDAGSSNGTFVDAQRLSARSERRPLRCGCSLRLGELETLFFTPPGFYAWLRSRRTTSAVPRPSSTKS